MKFLFINIAIASVILVSAHAEITDQPLNIDEEKIAWYSEFHGVLAAYYVNINRCNEDNPADDEKCNDLLDRTDSSSECFIPELAACNLDMYKILLGQVFKLGALDMFASLGACYGDCPIGDFDCYDHDKLVKCIEYGGNEDSIEGMKVLNACPKCNLIEICGGGGSPCTSIYDYMDCKECLKGLCVPCKTWIY